MVLGISKMKGWENRTISNWYTADPFLSERDTYPSSESHSKAGFPESSKGLGSG